MKDWVRYFLAANAFLIATGATLFTIEDVRAPLVAQFGSTPRLIVAALIMLELVVALIALLLSKTPKSDTESAATKSTQGTEDPYLDAAFTKVVSRFALPEDYEKLLAIYRQHFPSDTILPAEEYRLLMQPERGVVRVLEGVCANGIPKVIGFYSVWALARSTIDALAAGTIREAEIKSNEILEFDAAAASTLYVAEIAIAIGQPFGHTLMRDAKDYLLHLLESHPNLNSVSAWAYSEVGRRLASRMGMKKMTGRNGRQSDFFIVEIAEIRRSLRPEAQHNAANKFEPTRTIYI
jgi:hypothetical protein